jgi:Spy/CpxP family protein refolding chaperone
MRIESFHKYSDFEEDQLMNKFRIAAPAVIVAGLMILWFPAIGRADNARPDAGQSAGTTSLSAQPRGAAPPTDVFAGLSFTDEQRAEIDKIRQETESNRSVIRKDDKLTPDQKDAMLLGYTRLENGRIFKVLTPEQQKEVRQKVLARRAADQAAQQKRPPQH